ncbi:MAG: glycosyltransferase [Acidobacteriaceae bacterium]|nr:glycosyltransferase [Acidobacteriaceae bacterium]
MNATDSKIDDRSENGSKSIEISVVVPTYRRPDHLKRTLLSCIEQRNLERKFEIIVVDNDENASARTTVQTIAKATKIPIVYLEEARAGISWARNAGVAAASGRFIAFLDDDEFATPEWLNSLWTTIQDAGADIAFGPVIPRFAIPDAAVSAYAKKVYTRDAQLASGTELEWGAIGNCIIRAERCFGNLLPFDPRLGISGGEDALFLHQARADGRKLVWCAEAVVWETIPMAKLSYSYLLKRAFRGGQTTTFVHLATKPANLSRALRTMVIGCGQVAICAPAGGFLLLAGHSRALDVVAKAAGGLGKLVCHPTFHVPLYRSRK